MVIKALEKSIYILRMILEYPNDYKFHEEGLEQRPQLPYSVYMQIDGDQ